MSFASKIRKDILKVLDAAILPALRESSITQFLAEPPFHFGQIMHWPEQQKILPDKSKECQIIRMWPEEKLVALRDPVLRFVYQGVSFERIGITPEMAQQMKSAATGIGCVQIPAPGVICFGNHIPQSDGTLRADVWNGVTKSLLIKTMPECLLVSLCERSPQAVSATHNLEIRDATLLQMSKIYKDELRFPENEEGAQALLFSFMHRLKRYFQNNRPDIGNSAWVEFEYKDKKLSSLQLKNQEAARYMIEYMRTHLHQDLTLQKLASHFGLSVSHLNRIFRQSEGTSIMRYLTKLRMEAAKEIICKTSDRISEVAPLVGFTSVTSFSATFRKHTGHSPNQYRHLHRD
jgi:AraC-like DNA-binding protein